MKTWNNWAGNITYTPADLLKPGSTEEVQQIVAAADAAGTKIRPIGTGHSSMDLSSTTDTIVNLRSINGIEHVDARGRRVRLGAGTLIAEIGPLLWEHGLALHNQGDINAQQIAGAIATGTHGSGKRLQSFSGALTAATIVNGNGQLVQIDEHDQDLLHAVQVSLGALGVLTSVELSVRDAFAIQESIEYWSLGQLDDQWEEHFEKDLHFSFFWMPTPASAGIFNMEVPDGWAPDSAYVKIYQEEPVEALVAPEDLLTRPGKRLGRPYLIYPEQPTDVFHELEYMIPFERGKEAFDELRRLIQTRHPHREHPVEVRSVAADKAYLSPNFDRDNLVIAVHCDDIREGEPFLREVGAMFEQFDARPHWGKWHFMDRVYVGHAFPKLPDFRRVRAQLDPAWTFGNSYLDWLLKP